MPRSVCMSSSLSVLPSVLRKAVIKAAALAIPPEVKISGGEPKRC